MKAPHFLPAPPLAARDKRLSASDHRVLLTIAGYDRIGVNGRGCFATCKTIAVESGCSLRSVERSISRLQEYGYVRAERSMGDGRRMVLRVVYERLPAKSGGEMAGNTRQTGQNYPPTSNEVLQSNQPLANSKQRHNHISINDESHPGEPAPFLQNGASLHGETDPRVWVEYLRGGGSVGHYMSVTQRLMKAMSYEERSAHANLMFQIQDASSHGETEYHWAERLMNELSFLNDEASYDEAHSHDR